MTEPEGLRNRFTRPEAGVEAGPAAATATATTTTTTTPDHQAQSPASHDTSGDNGRKKTRVAPVVDMVIKPKSKRYHWLIFALGGLAGILLALFFADQNEVIDLNQLMDFNYEALSDVLPANFLKDVSDFARRDREIFTSDAFSVGLLAQSQGVRARAPVVMIPGVISTGLESWGTDEESRPYFRKRVWGSWSMLRALVMDKPLWRTLLMLDKMSGLDPPNAKVRAAEGFDATDFFITGYWIWSKILENLATIGYDTTNAHSAAYDWRLSYVNLERRDFYFSKLKAHIEIMVRLSGRKTVLASHSMGSQVVLFFFKWVEHQDYGGGGADWVERHIESWINISGCMLGTPKGLTAVLSGEMRDTAQLNAFALRGLDQFLSKRERAELFRAMPGISSMMPKGGEAVWGNSTWAPDDLPGQRAHGFTLGNMVNFRQPPSLAPSSDNNTKATAAIPPLTNLTVPKSIHYLLNHPGVAPPWYRAQVHQSYSHGLARTTAEVEANENDPRKWLNPLEVRLPRAPSMRIYCLYGVGKPTERSYFYKPNGGEGEARGTTAAADAEPDVPIAIDTNVSALFGNATAAAAAAAASASASYHPSSDTPADPDDAPDPDPPTMVDHGVVTTDGDGTVPLLSLGYMCTRGWQIRRFNPGRINVTTFEMPHEPDRFSPRGGPNTADHVDILGRATLNELVLKIAGGRGDEVRERFVSRIREYAQKVKVYEEGEEPDE